MDRRESVWKGDVWIFVWRVFRRVVIAMVAAVEGGGEEGEDEKVGRQVRVISYIL